MSNRSYVIVLSEQTFIHSWRIPPQTFVNSVSNKHTSASLDQGANWFGAPATNVRRVSEANRIFNRTNPPIVAKIKDYENCTHAKFAQFSNNWQRFFSDTRLRYKLSIIDPRLSQTHTVGHSSRCDIWTVTHMLASQLAATDCFHRVTKVSYS